jgi:hypothetical protein
VLGEIPKLFGRGFVVGFLFPAAIFLANLTYAWGFDVLGIGPFTKITVEGVGRATLAIVLAGLVLLLVNRPFVRVLEGYYRYNPLAVFGFVTKRRFRNHIKPVHEEWKRLEQAWIDNNNARPPEGFADKATEAASNFPHREDLILPTSFGNSYRAYETYPAVIYGMDAVLMWPRLLCIIPACARDQLQENRAKLDFHVNLFWLSVISIIGWLALVHDPAQTWRAVPPAIVAVVMWLVLPSVARSWGSSFSTIFDLYRAPLATSFGLTLPGTLAEERTMWTEIARSIRYRRAFTADYLDRYRATRETDTPKFEKLSEFLYVRQDKSVPPAEAGES